MNPQLTQRPVVVGVDGSDPALRAVRWAAAEASRRGAELRLVTAFDWAEDRVPLGANPAGYREALRRTARNLLAEAAAVAARHASDVLVARHTVHGPAAEVLRAESRRAQLLVVGDRGLSRLEGLLAGSVAVAMATTAACPVVVVHSSAVEVPASSRWPVVVGVDGSATSEAATEFAFAAATARGVPLIAVHTWWDPIARPALATVLDLDAIDREARELLIRRLAGWQEKYPSVQVVTAVLRDRPAHALLQHAARAQLLVVGSRGRGELAGLVLGSVSNAAVHRSPCPVAVVRPEASGRS